MVALVDGGLPRPTLFEAHCSGASRRFDKLDKFVTSKNNNGRRVPSLGGGGAGHKKSLQLFFLEGELQAMVYEERVVKPLRVIF